MEVQCLTPNKCCRLCLQAKAPYFSLFENQAAEMLESLTLIKLDPNGTTPHLTCIRCYLDLKIAYKIQQKFMEIDKILQEKLGNNFEIKQEDDISTEETNLNSNEQEEDISKEESNLNLNEQGEEVGMEDTNLSLNNQGEDIGMEELNLSPKQQEEDISTEDPSLNLNEQGEDIKREGQNVETNKQIVKIRKIAVVPLGTLDIKRMLKEAELGSSKELDPKQCLMCPKMLPEEDFHEHNKTHECGYCEYCGAILKNGHSLRNHVRVNHRQFNIKCRRCDAVLSSQKEYCVHLQRNHRSDVSYVCDECGGNYLTIAELKRHKLTKHSDERPFSCDVCNKGFVNKYKLYSHKLSHSDKMLFICEFCGRGFKFKANMNVHKKKVHKWKCDEKFKCGICKKGFSTEFGMNVHMLMHKK